MREAMRFGPPQLHDLGTCTKRGCEAEVYRYVLHPDFDDETMTVLYVNQGHDHLYRTRCPAHAEKPPGRRVEQGALL